MTAKEMIAIRRKENLEGKSERASLDTDSNSSVRDMITQRRTYKSIGFDTLANDVNSLSSDLKSARESYTDKDTMYGLRDRTEKMQSRLASALDYTNKYGDSGIDAGTIRQTQLSFRQNMSVWNDLTKLYDSYKDEDSFNSAVKKMTLTDKYKGKTYDEVQSVIKNGALKENEHGFSMIPAEDREFFKNYGINVGYDNVEDYDKEIKSKKDTLGLMPTYSSDYKALSDEVTLLTEKRNQLDLSTRFERNWADTMNAPDFKEKSSGLEEGKALPKDYNLNQSDIILESMKNSQYMTDDEKAVLYYLSNTDSKKAKEYYDDMKIVIDKRATEKMENDVADLSKSGFLGGVAGTAIGLAGSLSPMGFIDDVAQAVQGKELNPYSSNNLANNLGNSAREAVSSTFDSKLGSFLYDTAFSTAQSAIGANLYGHFFTGIMGMTSAQQKLRENKEKGYNDGEALANAFITGAIESACEYLPTERYLTLSQKDIKGFKNGFKAIAGQAVEEGLEEGVTETLNIAVDYLERGGASDLMKDYNALLERGYTKQEASTEVAKKYGEQILLASAGGALSGGFMGTIGTVQSKINSKNDGSEIKSVDTLKRSADIVFKELDSFNNALEKQNSMSAKEKNEKALKGENMEALDMDTKPYEELYERLKAGEELSDSELGHLYGGIRDIGTKLNSEASLKAVYDMETLSKSSLQREAELQAEKAESDRQIAHGERVFSEKYDRNSLEQTREEYIKAKYGDDAVSQYAGIVEAHNGDIDEESLTKAYTTAVEYGENGLYSSTDAVNATKGILSESEALKAYKLGSEKFIAQNKATQAKINNAIKGIDLTEAKAGTFDTSAIKGMKLTKYQRKSLQVAEAFSKLGINVEIFSSKQDAKGNYIDDNGSYNNATNTIRLDINAGLQNGNEEAINATILPTFSHELTHWAENKSKPLYNVLRDSVFDILAESDGLSAEKRIDLEIKSLEERGVEATESVAISEIVARTCEDCFQSSQKMKDLFMQVGAKDKGLLRNFASKLKQTATKIKDMFGELMSMLGRSNESSVARTSDKFESLVKTWESMIDEALKVNQSNQNTGNASNTSVSQERYTTTPESILSKAEANPNNETEQRLLSEYKFDSEVANKTRARLSEIKAEMKKKGANKKALTIEQKTLENRLTNYNREMQRLEKTATLQKVFNRETANNLVKRSELVISAEEERARQVVMQTVLEESAKYQKQTEKIIREFAQKEAIATYGKLFDEAINKANTKKLKEAVEKEKKYRRAEREQAHKELVKTRRELNHQRVTEKEALAKEYQDKIKEVRENFHESSLVNKFTKGIIKNAIEMRKMLAVNSAEYHVTKDMRIAVAMLCDAIDPTSKRGLGIDVDANGNPKKNNGTLTKKDVMLSTAFQTFSNVLRKGNIETESTIENVSNEVDNLYAMLPEAYFEQLADVYGNIVKLEERSENGRVVLSKMSADDLKVVYDTMRMTMHLIKNVNKFYASRRGLTVKALCADDMIELRGKNKVKNSNGNSISNFFKWRNMQPKTVFDRISSGSKELFGGLQRGFTQFAFDAQQIIEYAEETFDAKKAEAWETEAVEISDMYGERFKLSTAQLMSLYCLSKREQALGHIFGGGIVIAPFKDGKNVVDTSHESYNLDEESLAKAISNLTAEQIEVADKLQTFMNTVCSAWGNEVSMDRLGIEQFGDEEYYFPIKSHSGNQNVREEDEHSLFSMLNMSFAKSLTKGANNALVVSDIFTVFAKHSTDMAKYHSMALPVTDLFKWLNYREGKKGKDAPNFKKESLRDEIAKTYGNEAVNYIMNLVKDLSGMGSSIRDEDLISRAISNVKRASVGANLSVALLQPTSYFRALAVLDAKYMAEGLRGVSLFKQKSFKEACKWSGMARYKQLGFYDINASNSIESKITRVDTKLNKIGEASMKLAEIGDSTTWGVIWYACQAKTKAENKDLKVGSKEFYEQSAVYFDEVIYSTQVIDTVLTRSEIMRSKSTMSKIATSFMSEPTVSYNLVVGKTMELIDSVKEEGYKMACKKLAPSLRKAILAHCVTSLASSMVRMFVEWYRDNGSDDEKDDAFIEKLLRKFVSESTIEVPYFSDALALLVSQIKFVKDDKELAKWVEAFFGYDDGKRLDLQGYIDMGKAIANTYSTFRGNSDDMEKLIQSYNKAISELTGVPAYGFSRDFISFIKMVMKVAE